MIGQSDVRKSSATVTKSRQTPHRTLVFSALMHCALTVARIPFCLRSIFSDRKVIGNSCSTVPLRSRECAIHVAQRPTHAFISPISDSHEDDTKYFDRVKRCSALVRNKLHFEDRSAQVHHSDVGDQSVSIARNAHSAGYEPYLIPPRCNTNFMSSCGRRR